jgi:divalent metal cation (Fe/Co/Zn/Cd) transporter
METMISIAEPAYSAHPAPVPQHGAKWARQLAWVSLTVVLVEGAVGLWQGLAVGSVALTGWALGGGAEALASAMVVWRFSGTRTSSETAERRAQQGVALSFWLTAPYIAAEAVRQLIDGRHADTSMIGIGLTAIALLLMPILGWAGHRLGAQLHSGATEGAGTQNYLCAIQAAGVFTGLAITGTWTGGWWIDPAIGLVVAGIAVWQGVRSWRGLECSCR